MDDLLDRLRDTRYTGQYGMRLEAAEEIERLRAIEKAARTYYHNYCQDEANEEGVCELSQQLDAIALRDALAVEQSANLDDVKDMKTWPDEIRRAHGIKVERAVAQPCPECGTDFDGREICPGCGLYNLSDKP